MSKPQELTPIKSSMLTGYIYDPASRVMTVEYTNGTRYNYADVPAEKVEAFRESSSPGSFFAQKIRNNHAATKL